MNLIKRLIPGKVKQECRYFLQRILSIPYSRSGTPIELLEWMPKNSPITFYDIGANAGHFSKSICEDYQIKKAILVEPIKQLIPALEKKFPNRDIFQILNVAIAESNAEKDFFIYDEFNPVSSLLKMHHDSDELKALNVKDSPSTKVQTLTLDHISKVHNISNIDLLKIDVQGAEHLVLQSGTETLKKTRLVYTEFSFKPLYENSSTFFDLYKIMYDNNFILTTTTRGYASPNGELLQGDALFVNKAFIK